MKKDNINWKVCVQCFTFNQAKYITTAMNGFTLQQTNFPFVCCIVDDCSTDGEQEIIKQYVDRNFDFSEKSMSYKREVDYGHVTFAQHKHNKNCYFVVLLLKENLYSKKETYKKLQYIAEWEDRCEFKALCEGDDWWLSKSKLQKQYNALLVNPQVDMCATGAICYKDGIEESRISPSNKERILTAEETISGGGGYLGTNSLMYRRSLDKNKMKFRILLNFDYTLQIQGSLRGGIYYIPEFMSAYRLCADNSWTNFMEKNPKEMVKHRFLVKKALCMLDQETGFKYHKCIVKHNNIITKKIIKSIIKMPINAFLLIIKKI